MNNNQIKELAYLIAKSVNLKCSTCKARSICDAYTGVEGPYDCAHMWEILIKKHILDTTI